MVLDDKVMLSRAGTQRRLRLCVLVGVLLTSAAVARLDIGLGTDLASHTTWHPDEAEQQHLASQIANSAVVLVQTQRAWASWAASVLTKGGTTAAWTHLQLEVHTLPSRKRLCSGTYLKYKLRKDL